MPAAEVTGREARPTGTFWRQTVGITEGPAALSAPPGWCAATPPFHRPASIPHPRRADTAIPGATIRHMADKPNKRHLSQDDLGSDAAAILTALANSLDDEEKWMFRIEGVDYADVDDGVRQRINDLKAHNEIFEGGKASLVRFKTDKTYRTTTPTFVVPLKVDPERSRISAQSLQVGKVLYITGDVPVTSPLDVLLLQERR